MFIYALSIRNLWQRSLPVVQVLLISQLCALQFHIDPILFGSNASNGLWDWTSSMSKPTLGGIGFLRADTTKHGLSVIKYGEKTSENRKLTLTQKIFTSRTFSLRGKKARFLCAAKTRRKFMDN